MDSTYNRKRSHLSGVVIQCDEIEKNIHTQSSLSKEKEQQLNALKEERNIISSQIEECKKQIATEKKCKI